MDPQTPWRMDNAYLEKQRKDLTLMDELAHRKWYQAGVAMQEYGKIGDDEEHPRHESIDKQHEAWAFERTRTVAYRDASLELLDEVRYLLYENAVLREERQELMETNGTLLEERRALRTRLAQDEDPDEPQGGDTL